MTPGMLDMYIEEGATYEPTTITIRYKDTKQPVDLSIYSSASLEMKEHWWDTTVDFNMTTANGRLTLGGAAGTITRFIAKVDAEDFSATVGWTKGVYVLRLVKSTGEEDPLLRGNVFVNLWAEPA